MKYRKLNKYKYQLVEDEVIDLSTNFAFLDHSPYVETSFIKLTNKGILTLKKGYAWNGANCFPDFEWIKYPSMVHDVFCQLVQEGYLSIEYRKKADKLIRKMCKKRLPKYTKFMAFLVYKGVKIGTKFSNNDGKKQDKIYEVF